MKLIDLTCPKCGAVLQVNEELKNGMCNHCGYTFLVDDEVKKMNFENSEQAGYEFEQGRMRAIEEQKMADERRKREEEYVAKQKAKKSLLWFFGVLSALFAMPLYISIKVGALFMAFIFAIPLICFLSVALGEEK